MVAAEGPIAGLDGIRGVAVLLVILCHVQTLVTGGPHVWLVDGGWAGVDLFFVLSGFLITRILRRSREEPRYFRTFFVRRALRILPLYFAVLALVLLPRALVGLQGAVPWWSYPLFVSNFWIALYPGQDLVLDVTWSLAIEEQFYLLWPALVLLLSRRQLMLVCAAIVVASPALRGLLHDPTNDIAYMWTPCRIDTLAWGALAWLVVEREAPAIRRLAPWAAAILLGGFGASLAAWGDTRPELAFAVGGYTAIAAGCAAFLVALTTGRVPRIGKVLVWPPLASLGKVSFGAYLIHSFWGVVLADQTALGWPLVAAIVLPATWASSWLVWRTLESPILAWKDRLAPSGEAARAAV